MPPCIFGPETLTYTSSRVRTFMRPSLPPPSVPLNSVQRSTSVEPASSFSAGHTILSYTTYLNFSILRLSLMNHAYYYVYLPQGSLSHYSTAFHVLTAINYVISTSIVSTLIYKPRATIPLYIYTYWYKATTIRSTTAVNACVDSIMHACSM